MKKFATHGIEMIMLSQSSEGAVRYFDAISTHLTEIFEIYSELKDDSSRETLLGYLLGRISQKINFVKFDPAPQYFLSGFLPEDGDVVIDGGAFDGTTALDFRRFGCRVYSFELDPNNFPRAKSLGEQHGFVVENLGLGLYQHDEYFVRSMHATATKVSTEGGDGVAKIISIDKYVAEKNLPRVDFIKMDIEGAELDALKGAALSIARWKPKLAISAYHKPEDVFTLAKFLKKIRPDYEFAFRHYAMITDDPNAEILEDGQASFLQSYNLAIRIPWFGEAVLYAR